MKIELISKDQHETLKGIYLNHPLLTLQNVGYETINESHLDKKDLEALEVVNGILKLHICGFSSFQNFKLNKEGEVVLRLQYNYGYDGGLYFVGVGYLKLDELLNGFDI